MKKILSENLFVYEKIPQKAKEKLSVAYAFPHVVILEHQGSYSHFLVGGHPSAIFLQCQASLLNTPASQLQLGPLI